MNPSCGHTYSPHQKYTALPGVTESLMFFPSRALAVKPRRHKFEIDQTTTQVVRKFDYTWSFSCGHQQNHPIAVPLRWAHQQNVPAAVRLCGAVVIDRHRHTPLDHSRFTAAQCLFTAPQKPVWGITLLSHCGGERTRLVGN